MARISRRVVLGVAPIVPFIARTLFSQMKSSHKPLLYIGTYTHDMGPGGKADGIYVAEWDAHAGVLAPLRLAVQTIDPSFLAVPPHGDALYAVNEGQAFPGKDGTKGGSVTAFRRNAATGALTEVNVVPSGGTDPCHITIDRAGRAVFVANYTSGTLTSYRVTQKGLEGPIAGIVFHGHGPNAERQEGPHAHCVTLSPDERFLLVSDLGADQIRIYRVDLKTAMLTDTGQPWHAKPGSGPRHTHFHPNGKWVYSVNELTSTVDLLAWDAQAGALKWIAEVPMRAADYTGTSTGAELAIDRSAKFLYASNRAEDTIVAFSIDPRSGALTFLQRISCGGKTPRDFTLDPSEKWLVIANQDTQNIVVLERDPGTGKLTATGRSYTIGAPVAVLFV